MAKIIIRRKSSMVGCMINFDVYLKNTYVGELKSDSLLAIPVEVGMHTLSFKSKFGIGKKCDTVFNAVVNEENEIVELKTKFDMNGNLVVSYADNKPHIPAFEGAENSYFGNADLQQVSYSAQKNRVKFKRTVRCRTCGAEISPNAQRCPYCGEKPLGVAVGEGILELIKGIVLFPFILILVVIAIGFYIGLFSL